MGFNVFLHCNFVTVKDNLREPPLFSTMMVANRITLRLCVNMYLRQITFGIPKVTLSMFMIFLFIQIGMLKLKLETFLCEISTKRKFQNS